ncbi:hypothetical protein VNO78_27415 [Psophocarpus tetragonolobus]
MDTVRKILRVKRNQQFPSGFLSGFFFPPYNNTRHSMARDSCLARVTAGAAMGGAVGGAVGAVYGTYEAIRYKVPGLLKIRHIGQTTLGSAAIFGLFLGAGSLIHCGKSY